MITVDLSGKWEAYLDEAKVERLPQSYPDSITLPDSTSNAGLFKRNEEIEYGCLTDVHKFEGYAWFKRTVEIPAEAEGKYITLFLERTRMTAVYIDGRMRAMGDSLCSPHRFMMSGLSAGSHELIIRVSNTDYPTGGGHMTSRDTQTNWNGIIGRMELQIHTAYPEAVYLLPNIGDMSVEVRCEISAVNGCGTAKLRVYDDCEEYGSASADYADRKLSCKVKLSEKTPLWDEFAPNLLKMDITVGEDTRTVTFGMREMRAEGLKLLVNGRETFLRGKHDGMVFPKTGYAPAEVSEWLEVFETAKQYGINHYRFHTCCPPEAAFEAADIAGIYMQPELPFWGTIPDEFGEEHKYLRSEGFRILREFSHHPSFVMMSMGNELWGSKERLNELIAGYREVCPDKLYVGGSNNYQFVPCVLDEDDFFSGVRFDRERLIRGSYAMCDAPQGHIQTGEPNAVHCYDPYISEQEILGGSEGGEIMIQYGTEMKKVKADNSDVLVPDVPVISHEVGQFAMYPDFDEIGKYAGAVRHTPFESYRQGLTEKGLFDRWEDFFRASGKLSVQCYRDDIETAMRSELMSGFQLLDIQDFPGQGVATVGILNTFLENKGHVTAEEWRRYCAPSVVLASVKRFVYRAGEELEVGLLTSSTEPGFCTENIHWSVTVDGETVAEGISPKKMTSGRITRYQTAVFTVNCDKPVTAVLEISAEGTDVRNSYNFYIYPDIDVKITETEITYGGRTLPVTHDFEQAKSQLSLYIPIKRESDLAGEYCTDFWCYGMFRSISESMGKPVPTGTLGLFIDEKSPLLGGFPTEYYTTPRWYNIVSHSHCADLDGTEIEPDVWVIDNPERRKRLALLYRQEGAVCCTSRLWEIADRIEVKHFAAALVESVLSNG